MSFNRVCNCICNDPDDGGGGGAMCEQGQCPDVFGLDVVVPATKCHNGRIASTNCCGFDTTSWSHSLSMTNYSNCEHDCSWKGKTETPHCISATDCGFPFNSMTPDVSCYDSPAAIFKGVDHPTTAQANGTEQCSSGGSDFGICQCNVGNGACVTSGIGTISRNSMYTLHTGGSRGSSICYRCGCNIATCGNDNSGCPHGGCSTCVCCPTVYPACSDHTTDGQVLYAGGLSTRIYGSMEYGQGYWGLGERFYLTVHVAGITFYAGQFTNCLGEWGSMISDHSNCENFCCTENPSADCPMWTPSSQTASFKCGFEGNCSGGFEDFNTPSHGIVHGTSQIWAMPTSITPANCLELRGVTQSTSGVVIARDYDRADLNTFAFSCAKTALDGDDLGRYGYFGIAKEFSPTWTIT